MITREFFTLLQVCLVQKTLTLGKSDRRVVIMCDNATIYKSCLVRMFFFNEESEVLMITTPSYYPLLNAAEKIILAIKEKWKKVW